MSELINNSINNDDLLLILFGTVLGLLSTLIGGTILPIIQSNIDTERRLRNFKKQLKFDIENLKNSASTDLKSFSDRYEIELFEDAIQTGYAINSNDPPAAIVCNFSSDAFRKNWDLFVILDSPLQGKINEFYRRIESLNYYPQIYKDLPIDHIKERQTIIFIYLNTLKIAHDEAEEILAKYQ